jgi:hypothetical protein
MYDRRKCFTIVKPWSLGTALGYQLGFILDNVASLVTLFGEYPFIQDGSHILQLLYKFPDALLL